MKAKNDRLIYRSAVTQELLSNSLKKGALVASGSALLIIVAGTFLPLSLLKIGGLPLFLLGLSGIAYGWLPYKKLSQLQLKPHEIHMNEQTLIFLCKNKPALYLSLTTIEKVAYQENQIKYGLAIWLKRPILEKIKVLDKRLDKSIFANEFKCDLFLPYFSKGSCLEITKDWLELSRAS